MDLHTDNYIHVNIIQSSFTIILISQFILVHSTDKHGERFCSILTGALTSNTWKVQLVVLTAIKLFIERSVNVFVLFCCFLEMGNFASAPYLKSLCFSEWIGPAEPRMVEEKRVLIGSLCLEVFWENSFRLSVNV